MLILHIIVGLGPGGAKKMLARLIGAGAGDPSLLHSVISLTDLGVIGVRVRQRGIQVQPLGLRSAVGVPWVFFQLVRHIRRIRPDIVQTWMYHADLLGGLAARLAGRYPVIWGVRTTDVPAGRKSLTAVLRWVCARLSHRSPDAVVCAAQASRLSHETLGYDAAKMVVISNGYDLSWLEATAQERRTLRAGLGFDDGSALLRDWIAASGLAPRFILAGERSDVPQCLAAMDVFCLHSRNEGFPNVLAEAMAMGLPCVTTDVGDAAMLIDDTGAVVPAQDPAQLARAVDRLLRMDPPSRSHLGQRAKTRIERKFSIATTSAGYVAVYQRALGEDAHP